MRDFPRWVGSAAGLATGFLLLMGTAGDVAASRRTKPTWNRPTFASALVIDAETGAVLYEKDPDSERAPASLVKMMLELLIFEAIERGEISLEDPVKVPREARQVRGSRVRLRTGETVTVRDLLRATVIASANDAAVALGSHLAGSVESCISLMNRRALDLGMVRTRYVNVHGLDYGGEPGNVTTAADQAILARRLTQMPEALKLSSTREATIRGNQTIRSTNRLLARFPGLDGLKTGYTGRAGYCLVTTARRHEMRLISVVLGSKSSWRRFNETADLLHRAFLDWQKVRVVSKGEDLGEELVVRDGSSDSVRLLAAQDLDLLVPTKRRKEILIAVSAPPSTKAPITEGWTLGRVQVLLGDSVAAECAALAAGDVRRTDRIDGLNQTAEP